MGEVLLRSDQVIDVVDKLERYINARFMLKIASSDLTDMVYSNLIKGVDCDAEIAKLNTGVESLSVLIKLLTSKINTPMNMMQHTDLIKSDVFKVYGIMPSPTPYGVASSTPYLFIDTFGITDIEKFSVSSASDDSKYTIYLTFVLARDLQQFTHSYVIDIDKEHKYDVKKITSLNTDSGSDELLYVLKRYAWDKLNTDKIEDSDSITIFNPKEIEDVVYDYIDYKKD